MAVAGRDLYRKAREAVDPILAVVLLVLLAPVMAVAALAIVLDDGRPVLFRQRRAGLRGRPFRIVKFRTMTRSAPPYSLKVDEGSALITRVGRVLRRTGLDEAPNLWNVIRGEMALIGPRPEQYELLDRYETWQLERHDVKPGITGWWQIHHRDAEPMHLNVDKDIYYVRRQSPALDAQIVAGTVRVLVAGIARRLRPAA
jgi:sugar transferase EpsL